MPEPTRPFVLLQHTLSDAEHWDLMLDRGDMLATWQLCDDPRSLMRPAGPHYLHANRIPDHRRAYLNYEGPVSQNRGHVAKVDQGTCTVVRERVDYWEIRLSGQILAGTFCLALAQNHAEGWLLQRLDELDE